MLNHPNFNVSGTKPENPRIEGFKSFIAIASKLRPKPKRELQREAPQLSFGFWFCHNINGYSSLHKT